MNRAGFKPVIVLVGRPNVGKSTLFNRLTRSRAALVADQPGLTRDRHYGEGRMGSRPYIVVDTGGFEPVAKDGILREMARQTEQAIAESDIVFFLVDARAGLSARDHEIARMLRRTGRTLFLVVNKAEGMRGGAAANEFHELGLGPPHAISASHGDGVGELVDAALATLPSDESEPRPPPDHADGSVPAAQASGDAAADHDSGSRSAPRHRVKLAIVGRPNVGKSTLINTLLGEERVIAFDQPGTTRDAIEVEFERGGVDYVLIDTAGLRRRGKVFETVEKFSVIKTLQAIEASNVVVFMVDAQAEVSDQDAHIAGFIVESGRALVVAVNKWDGLDAQRRDRVRRDLDRKLHFLSFARWHMISALTGRGVDDLIRSVEAAHAAAFAKLSTPKLTRVLLAAVAQQPPPRVRATRPKMRYAHQGGQNPPLIVIHGSALGAVSQPYTRYLESCFRRAFALDGTPLRIEFKLTRNPYVQGAA